MRSLAIAIVAACPFPANHGTPGHIREMSQAVASLGHRVHVVTYPMGQDIPVAGIKIHRAGLYPGKNKIKVGPTYDKPLLDIVLVIKLCRVIWKEGIDIIHAFNYEGALAGYFAKIITKRPMVYYAINNMIDELPTYNFIRPRFLARIVANLLDYAVPRTGDYVTVLSEELYDFLVQKGIPGDKMSVIPAGVNIQGFEGKDPTIIRDRYGIGSRPLVVYTGTLDNFQGVDYLIKAMKVVTSTVNEAVLLIAGNIVRASDVERYKRLAVDTGVDKNVIFANDRPLEELPYFLASADVAVVPRPACPGFPIKLLNYMAAGKGIVVFEGSAKGLKDRVNAIVAESGNFEELGRGIARLLTDKDMASDLGLNARKAIQGTFDWHTVATKIEKIYTSILKN